MGIEQGGLPALITRYGPARRIVLDKKEIESIAFDEEEGHLSHLFKGRLFRIHVDNWIEEVVAVDVTLDLVDQELEFVRFNRHVPAHVITVPIPVTLAGLFGCPGYMKGGSVDLAMPTIDVECVGDIPTPFVVDVSKLDLDEPYGKITLADMLPLLPADGTARFSREYTLNEDVVMCYTMKQVEHVPLPEDWQDPNFITRSGRRLHLTYTGFW